MKLKINRESLLKPETKLELPRFDEGHPTILKLEQNKLDRETLLVDKLKK